MTNFKTLCMAVLLLISSIHARNKLVILVSIPRCLSTAFLRMMRQRGDFTILNEPGIQIYQKMIFGENNLQEGLGLDNKTLSSFDALKDALSKALEHNNVFVKEIGCAAALYLMHDNELIHNHDCYVLFLLRDPHASFISLYKKLRVLIPDPLAFRELNPLTWPIISYEPMLKLYRDISACAHHKPLVLCAEDVVKNPELMIEKFCTHSGITFDPTSLTWEPHTTEFSPQEVLGDTKSHHASSHWHKEALASTGFGTLSQYTVDKNGEPTFEEIDNPEIRIQYKAWYNECLPYYEELLHHALRGEELS